MDLPRVPDKAGFMDSAVKKALKSARGIKKYRSKSKQIKATEAKKVEVVGRELSQKLHSIGVTFPNIDEMHPFHKSLISTTVNLVSLKQSLAQLEKSSKILKKLRFDAIKKIYRTNSKIEANNERKRFFARADSIISKAMVSLNTISTAAMILKSIPRIKPEAFIAILAGFPNTGKTTILSRITESKPEIASYPFTTKILQFGGFTYKYHEIQMVDSPGILDREMEKRNVIEKKAIAALQHLGDMILFIIDPTEQCGYSLERQLKLLKEVNDSFGKETIVVLNKADIATEQEMEKVKGLKNTVLCGEGIDCGLRELIGKEAIKSAKAKNT